MAKPEAKRVVEKAHERGDFPTLECGYRFFWISNRGAASASDLRALADELDRLNKDWDQQVRRDMERLK